MNKNELKMNKFLCYFGKILEWLMKGRHFRKIKIHSINDEATISLNVWVTTFGPPCTLFKSEINCMYKIYVQLYVFWPTFYCYCHNRKALIHVSIYPLNYFLIQH